MERLEELIGKRTIKLFINEDQNLLRFMTAFGRVSYYVVGDCCSQSWFADITGVHALLSGTIRSADKISMDGYNVDDGRGKQQRDLAYGYKLTTDKGYADIVFRNSSNGYYGGSIKLYTGPEGRGKGLDTQSFQEIKDDWSA